MSETVRVNFAQSTPLFPLADTVLLPHAVLPLHVFEPRYRQMVSDSLDRNGQIAIATLMHCNAGEERAESPPLRAAACVGQIIQHEALPDGRFNILLHGLCRARIQRIIEPRGERAYRLAMLEPIETLNGEPEPMPEVRENLRSLLTGRSLRERLRGIETLMDWVDRDDVPTHALLELIGFALVRDTELKYRLLEEPNPWRRASLITDELRYIDHLVIRALHLNQREWPKGVSWN